MHKCMPVNLCLYYMSPLLYVYVVQSGFLYLQFNLMPLVSYERGRSISSFVQSPRPQLQTQATWTG